MYETCPTEPAIPTEYAVQLKALLHEAFNSVCENLVTAHNWHYDHHVHGNPLQLGDLVLLNRPYRTLSQTTLSIEWLS